MPELPEVETVRTGLEMALKGAVIERVLLRRDNLRVHFPPKMAQKLSGRAIKSIKRRAKYLLFSFDSDDILIAHLGMSGRFTILPKPPKSFATHDHVVFYLKGGHVLIYNDARRFGLMDITTKRALAAHELLAHLGPEPLEKTFSASYLKQELMKRKGPVKPALMDQALVVGVGNIYASEALFLAGIDPRRPARDTTASAVKILSAIQKTLRAAIASGGSSLRDFVNISGESGYFQHHFNVYNRAGQPCFTCKTAISQTKQAGRSTFFCPKCQQ